MNTAVLIIDLSPIRKAMDDITTNLYIDIIQFATCYIQEMLNLALNSRDISTDMNQYVRKVSNVAYIDTNYDEGIPISRVAAMDMLIESFFEVGYELRNKVKSLGLSDMYSEVSDIQGDLLYVELRSKNE